MSDTGPTVAPAGTRQSYLLGASFTLAAVFLFTASHGIVRLLSGGSASNRNCLLLKRLLIPILRSLADPKRDRRHEDAQVPHPLCPVLFQRGGADVLVHRAIPDPARRRRRPGTDGSTFPDLGGNPVPRRASGAPTMGGAGYRGHRRAGYYPAGLRRILARVYLRACRRVLQRRHQDLRQDSHTVRQPGDLRCVCSAVADPNHLCFRHLVLAAADVGTKYCGSPPSAFWSAPLT